MTNICNMTLDKIKLHLNEISFVLDNIVQINNKPNIQHDEQINMNISNVSQNIQNITPKNNQYSDEPYVEVSLMDLDNHISNSLEKFQQPK